MGKEQNIVMLLTDLAPLDGLLHLSRPFSESVGSLYARESVVLSESQTDPELRCGPILTTWMDGWEPTESPVDQPPFPTSVVGQTGEIHRMDRVACRPIIKCRETGCAGSCTPSEVVHGYQAGKETVTCRICETATTSLFPISILVKMPLLPHLDVPAGFLGVNCRVNSRHLMVKMQSRKSARSLTIPRSTNWGNISRTCQRTRECDEEEAALLAAVSGHCAPSESTFFRRLRHVLCRWTKSSVLRVREPCCFTPLRWSRDFDEFLRVIRRVWWKRYNTSAPLHTS